MGNIGQIMKENNGKIPDFGAEKLLSPPVFADIPQIQEILPVIIIAAKMLTMAAISFMLGMLQREGYPKQHDLYQEGSYAKISSITQNKNVCAPDPRSGVGAISHSWAKLSIQQVRIFIWGCL